MTIYSGLSGQLIKLAYLMRLRRDEWLSESQLRQLQSRRLRALIAHAYTKVPFYRRLLADAGILPEEIRSADDLPRLPIVTKPMLREQNADDITSIADTEVLPARWTSGSSGVPLAIYNTNRELLFRGALATRGNLAAGIRPFDRRLSLGPPRPSRVGLTQRLGILPKRIISAFEDVEIQAAALLREQPDVLAGYPSCLSAVAKFVDQEKIKRGFPRLIVSGGELLIPETRRILEEVFNCPVIDAYGTEEIGRIAIQCGESHGFHVNSDVVIVEVVKDGVPVKPGEEGNLVVTGLMARTMPFIRYQLDDLASLKSGHCSCGRALPLLGSLLGRFDDLIRLPGGVVKHPVVVAYPIVGTPGISKFQVIQEEPDRFTILLQKEKGFTDQTIPDLESKLKKDLGDFFYDIQSVDEIPRDRSGKQKTIRSKVTST